MPEQGQPGAGQACAGSECTVRWRNMRWDAEKYIIFEDDDILICRKPAGMAVQNRKAGSMDLESLLKNYLSVSIADGSIPYLAVIHRLDQPVEGLVIFARTEKAASALSMQMQQGKMSKIYLAVVKRSGKADYLTQKKGEQEKNVREKSVREKSVREKNVQEEKILNHKEQEDRIQKNSDLELKEQGKTLQEGFLEDFLLKDGRTNMSRIVKKNTPGAKKAALFYRVIEENEEKMLVRIKLLTGRHHQIRVQMANAGMPLLGDQKYGEEKQIKKGGFPALCAAELSFTHPITGRDMHFWTKPENMEFACFANLQEWPKTGQ